jgi:hypothetical protein
MALVIFRLVGQGYDEGLTDGNVSGHQKGFELGISNGAVLNKEVL